MKKVLYFFCVFALAMLTCTALAAETDFSGTWLYEEKYSDYGDVVPAYQQVYAHSSYEMVIDGERVVIRAHAPYIYPFYLTLNEENGWFETNGTIRDGVLEVTWLVPSMNANGQAQRTAERGAFAIREETTDFGETKLVIYGGALEQIGTELAFKKKETGLSFEAEQTYGSWRVLPGQNVGYSRHATYFSGDMRTLCGFLGNTNYDLYISPERVLLIEKEHYESDALFSQTPYAIEATDVQIKEGGIFANFGPIRVKIYRGQTGKLNLLPVLTDEEILSLGGVGYTVLGDEWTEFSPIFMDIYSESPEAMQGKVWPESISSMHGKAEKHEKQIGNLVRQVGAITFGENNAVAIELGNTVYEGTLSFPDPYSCEDKVQFYHFSFEKDGYTVGIMTGWEGSSFVLHIGKGEEGIQFACSDTFAKLPGKYRSAGYMQPEGDIAMWIEEESLLTIDENLTVTQTIGDKTCTDTLQPRDVMDQDSWVLGSVTLNGVTYTVSHDSDRAIKNVVLRSDEIDWDYTELCEKFKEITDDPETMRFSVGYSISTNGSMIDEEESRKLFTTFEQGVFYVTKDWKRVIFEQSALEFFWFALGEEVLFLQDELRCEIPVLAYTQMDQATTLRLDLHGTKASLVSRTDGTAELIVGIYHVQMNRAN